MSTAAEQRPIRVAFLVYSFHVGGLERCVTRLINGLDPARFSTQVVALSKIGDARSWIHRGDVPLTSLGIQRGNDPRLVWRLARLLRQQRIDILHSHNWGTLLEGTMARPLARIPVHVHAERGTVLSDLDHRGWKMKVRGRLMRWALGRADAVVAVAKAVQEKVERYSGFPASKIQVIENGVDAPPCADPAAVRQRLRQQLRIEPESVLLGSVGRLVDVKDFHAAVQALAQVVGQGMDLHLLLVGDGPERNRLESLAETLGVTQRLHLVGHQSNVGDWLAAMDLYLNCSKSEGQSQSVLEAMALGKTIIVTDVGDSARLVGGDGQAGRVVPAADLQALAGAVTQLAREPLERNRLAQNALERHARSYSIAKMLVCYEELYTELMVARGQWPRAGRR